MTAALETAETRPAQAARLSYRKLGGCFCCRAGFRGARQVFARLTELLDRIA